MVFLQLLKGYMMTESKTAEILNDQLGATIHGKTTKKLWKLLISMKQMQNLATKISNAIKETNGRLPKMRLT